MNITFDPVADEVILLLEIPYFVGSLALLILAGKAKSGWVKASFAGFAISMLAWRVLAILPSWWLYYAEGELGFGGQGCVEVDLSCLKQTVKDTVVVVQNAVVLGLFVAAFIVYQRRFPTQLAAGESKPEATGGYK